MSIPKYSTILYATDLGDNMRPAFRHAISLAQQYQAEIIMLHVAEPLGSTGIAMLELYGSRPAKDVEENDLQEILNKMEARIKAFYHDELGDDAHLVSDVVVMNGHPAEEISHYADKHDIDLIVMGTHTSDGFGANLLGSTARKLIHIAKKPVLVVPVVK